MTKGKRLGALVAVLALVCVGAGWALNYEETQEQIWESGEVILAIATEDVTAVSWENEKGSWALAKTDGVWHDEADEAFPVDTKKVEAMLKPLEALGAGFVIDEPEKGSDYGLDTPEGTITVTYGAETATLTLGALSRMDEQRYLEIGDGKVYLVTHDPLEEFSAVRDDVMQHDAIPDFSQVEEVVFYGAENYTLRYDPEVESLCAEDVYFAGETALDSGKVESYLNVLKGLSLEDYMTYTAGEEDLSRYGLNEPELEAEVRYSTESGDSGSFTLAVSRDPETEEDAESITAYVRVNDSEKVYRVGQGTYKNLLNAGVDDLRHSRIFTGEEEEITGVNVHLEGSEYRFESGGEEGDLWRWGETEFDAEALKRALTDVEAGAFTDQEPSGKEELRLELELDNETFPSLELTFYRLDGENCLAQVNGKTICTVARSQVIELAEAVNAVVLTKT